MRRKFLSGSKTRLLQQPIVNGQLLFPNDCSEIYYDVNGARRTLQGIVYVDSDSDLSGISSPGSVVYFSKSSGNFYVFNNTSNSFVKVNRTGVVTNLTSSQRESLSECKTDTIYIDSDTTNSYIGINISPSQDDSNSSSAGYVLWIRINGDNISNYTGPVSIKYINGSGNNSVVVQSAGWVVYFGDGNIESDYRGSVIKMISTKDHIYINSFEKLIISAQDIKFNDSFLNEPGGLVKLDSNGKIPASMVAEESNSLSNSELETAILNLKIPTDPNDLNLHILVQLSRNKAFTNYIEISDATDYLRMEMAQDDDFTTVASDGITPSYYDGVLSISLDSEISGFDPNVSWYARAKWSNGQVSNPYRLTKFIHTGYINETN